MVNESTFMLGADFSHHNWSKTGIKGNTTFFNPSYVDFIILKATEGKTYTDPRMNDWLQLIADTRGESGAPFIFFYHYARPENGNEPCEEAQHFIETIEPHLMNCGIALDWEGAALKVSHGERWAQEWLRQVRAATGNKTTPLFYTSAAYTHCYPKIAEEFLLWVAHYGTSKPKVDCWKTPTMWQFTSKPFDINIFYGSPADMVQLISGK